MKYMKKIILILALTLLLSPTGWSKWVEVVIMETGNSYYVDDGRIKKIGKYIYYWELEDFLRPDEWGDMSNMIYKEVDCEMLRYKHLKFITYKQPMGKGTANANMIPPDRWYYPPSNTAFEHITNIVCDYVDKIT